MTIYGRARRPYLLKTALAALHAETDQRVLDKSLRYFSQMPYRLHDSITERLLEAVEKRVLLFPYQAAQVLETVKDMHPQHPETLAARVHIYAFRSRREWLIRQKAGEAICTLPYRDDHVAGVAKKLIHDEHPWVRRAGCVLLTRAHVETVREGVRKLIYHPDAWTASLALYWLRHLEDKAF